MPDNLPHLPIPTNTWVDLYAFSGITVGQPLIVENAGTCDIYLAVQATKPDNDHDAYNILKRDDDIRLTNNLGDAGAWAFCNTSKGLISVAEREGFQPILNSALHDGYGNPIDSFKGGIDVHIADAHDKIINEFFYNITATTTTLTVAANAQDESITVASTAGFSVGDPIDLANGIIEESTHPIIIGIAGNIFSLDRPLDSAFAIGDNITKLISNMAVDGSVTPVSFRLSPHIGDIWHILRFLINMIHGSAADDSRFGSIASLTKGVVLRKFDGATGEYSTYTNWKNNGDMVLDMFDVDYGDKAGGGKFSTRGRFSIKSATEAVPKISQADGDYLEFLIQDDLTGVISFIVKAQGHIAGA